MKTINVGKSMLNYKDVGNLLGFNKSRSYQEIATFNKIQEGKGFKTFKGKVLAEQFYKSYGLERELAAYYNEVGLTYED